MTGFLAALSAALAGGRAILPAEDLKQVPEPELRDTRTYVEVTGRQVRPAAETSSEEKVPAGWTQRVRADLAACSPEGAEDGVIGFQVAVRQKYRPARHLAHTDLMPRDAAQREADALGEDEDGPRAVAVKITEVPR